MKECPSFVGSEALSETLFKEGFLMPSENFHTNNSRWLLRSEPYYDINLATHRLTPKPGEFASYGVFFTDNLHCLPYYPDSSLVFIFDKNMLAKDWLIINSSKWKTLTNWLCKKQSLDISRIGDCMNAERLLYERFSTYNPINGVYTIPNEVRALGAERIIVPIEFDHTNVTNEGLQKICAVKI